MTDRENNDTDWADCKTLSTHNGQVRITQIGWVDDTVKELSGTSFWLVSQTSSKNVPSPMINTSNPLPPSNSTN